MLRIVSALTLFSCLSACATHEPSDYPLYVPVLKSGFDEGPMWQQHLQVCRERLKRHKPTSGAYRFGFNDCMRRLGYEIDWRATEKKYDS